MQPQKLPKPHHTAPHAFLILKSRKNDHSTKGTSTSEPTKGSSAHLTSSSLSLLDLWGCCSTVGSPRKFSRPPSVVRVGLHQPTKTREGTTSRFVTRPEPNHWRLFHLDWLLLPSPPCFKIYFPNCTYIKQRKVDSSQYSEGNSQEGSTVAGYGKYHGTFCCLKISLIHFELHFVKLYKVVKHFLRIIYI